MHGLRRYPDSRIVAVCSGLPVRFRTVTFERLPAYSGATVPASNRLPAQTQTDEMRDAQTRHLPAPSHLQVTRRRSQECEA